MSCRAPVRAARRRRGRSRLGELERALAGADSADADESDETLAEAIRDAVDVAITMCENGEDASQCAVAWEVVEELSSSASRRRGTTIDA